MKKNTVFLSKALMLLLGAIFAFKPSFSQDFTTSPFQNYSSISQKTDHAHHEKCGHQILENFLEKEMGYFGSKGFFEDWINTKIEARRNQPEILAKTQAGPRLIPVVVHVIHTGTSVGVGANIPLSQIEAQIRILNEDFRRLNPDANKTPAEFLPVAADSNIEFVLAKQDPNGLPTSGIVRLQGPKNTYNPEDATLIGQISQWNPDEYMNLWVVPLEQPYIGYASFPISNLPGLNFPAASAITDGVTVDYRFFGTGGSAVSASLGRTATHEVGHYFGLRHIWGDGGCGIDDYVADTPEQDASNNICNSNPSRFSCGSNDMIQNFMDYTPDACMNLFTLGQVERFDVVLANSPRRVTLVNNRATQEPTLPDLDLAITKIIEPGAFVCDPTITPSIEVLNAGKNTLTSARIQIRRNSQLLENKQVTFNLATGEKTEVTFTSFDLALSQNLIEFSIDQVNGQQDQNPENDQASISPLFQTAVNLPLNVDLGNIPGSWSIENPDEQFTWEPINLTISGEAQDLIYIRNYEYEAPGAMDYFVSPVINLAENPNAQLVFEVAHGPYDQSGFQDALIVAVSQDCGNTFDLVNATYNKSGQFLETSSPTLEEYIPASNGEFRTELVNLSPFADLGQVRIAFINLNSYGNNIYLKNIHILQNEEFKYELTLDKLLIPTPISDGKYESEEVQITNTGNLPVSQFVFTKVINKGGSQAYLASGSTVEPGETFVLGGGNSTLTGLNKIEMGTIYPNFDQNGGNESSLTRYTVEDLETIQVPWRQNFNNSSTLSPWISINHESNLSSWEIFSVSSGTGPNNVARLANIQSGQSYWLGSPLFDLSVSRQASLFFDLAAGEVSPTTRLQVLASEDGGENYEVVWEAAGTALSTVSAGAANPNSSGDYVRNYINLTDFAGSGKTTVRIAIVLDGGMESDSPVYIDNLELFLNANPSPVIPTEGMSVLYPNPAIDYFNLAFNLAQYETVTIQIVSSTGAIVHEVEYPRTLNQTYTFSTELFPKGLHILKITSESLRETKKLYIK
ncbi:choice-of-anchor J domain-containing protein [Algoriphagus sp. CAU 1675]|uniref:T9SS-dependent choice-of-anchor J family protein n=1 Tax=Algoriphagus sp. CAU 1675 TaxID=3032597 RepID=UPI0023DA4D6A|nr:choice-of-anchor J domain-containing protein [Algoriphagus sp. CAU 1675]MDF2158113.1 choice-of-anchor J domain-containing protein [Algoriphagus sp. CAU 1675]